MSNFSLLGCLELKLHILTLLRVEVGRGGGAGDPNFFLQISFSWVKMSFYVEIQPPMFPRTGQKVCGGWVAECEFSVLLWSKPFSLDLGFRLGPSQTINVSAGQ